MKPILKTACASLMALTVAVAAMPASADDWHRGGWRGGDGWHHHHHGGGDGAAIAAIGIGALAIGLIAASSSAHQPRYVDDGYDGPPPPPRPYYEAPSYRQSAYGYGDDGCLQTREYQTTITIDGRREPAYGTACLQPDGSWREGPAQPVQ